MKRNAIVRWVLLSTPPLLLAYGCTSDFSDCNDLRACPNGVGGAPPVETAGATSSFAMSGAGGTDSEHVSSSGAGGSDAAGASEMTDAIAGAAGSDTGLAASCTPGQKSCQGTQPVVCDPAGTWANAGAACATCTACQSTTGTCEPADGVACSDDNACTVGDLCKGGKCVSGSPLACPTSACQLPGTCDYMTGGCSASTKVKDGTACAGGVCSQGACVQCLVDGDCKNGYCAASICIPKVGEGLVCAADKECVSNVCGGRCCATNSPCSCPQPSAGNLIKNPGFDSSLANWTIDDTTGSGSITWVGFSTHPDSTQCPYSGIARFEVYGTPIGSTLSQCMPVSANKLYSASTRWSNDDTIGDGLDLMECLVTWYSGTSCDSPLLSHPIGSWLNVDWAPSYAVAVNSPAGSNSARLECHVRCDSARSLCVGDIDMISFIQGTDSY